MSANKLKNVEKTELTWASTRYCVANLCEHDMSLTLAADVVKVTDAILVLGVLFTSDLVLDKQRYIRQRYR